MNLDKDTFKLYAASAYDIRHAVSIEVFNEDLKRFQYLKRLFKRYQENGDLKTRLILNHIIVIYNCFGVSATPMLFLKLDGFKELLKPFLVFLNYMPDAVAYNGKTILSSDIPMDERIILELRQI